MHFRGFRAGFKRHRQNPADLAARHAGVLILGPCAERPHHRLRGAAGEQGAGGKAPDGQDAVNDQGAAIGADRNGGQLREHLSGGARPCAAVGDIVARLGGAALKPLVAAHHHGLHAEALDRANGAQHLDHEVVAAVVRSAAGFQCLAQLVAGGSPGKDQQDHHDNRHQCQRSGDQADQDKEKHGKGQIDKQQQPLAGKEILDRFRAAKPLQMNARRRCFERAKVRAENMVDRPAGELVLDPRAGPAGDVEAAQTQQKVEDQHDAQRDNENAESRHCLVGNDAVIDLQNRYRQGERQDILGAGREQKLGAITAHGVEPGYRLVHFGPDYALLTPAKRLYLRFTDRICSARAARETPCEPGLCTG